MHRYVVFLSICVNRRCWERSFSVKVLGWGLILFCVAVIFHLGLWRIKLPTRQMASLLKIFWVVLGGWLGVILAFHFGYIGYGLFSLSFAELIHVCLLFVSMALAYTLAYSTIEADSPSLRITLAIYYAGADGLDKDQLGGLLSMGDKFLASRIDSLVSDGMLIMKDGRYTVSPKGRLARNIVVYYRKLLGVPSELG